MLKALELNGFKSFADRTRLEFAAGITAVVGPNGSGKSNVVDAIKWVLGNQSAKALRGNEMTDVIFSGSGARKPANAAEVTLSFDNSAGVLNSDAADVHVTRRVLRSGESEYLLNRQVCRLRDIREVFAGIGVTTGAYSIIEQGRVDALLQSSPKERRLIFEEAAGVSRFKMKRQEAARRLERIEQNLLRLADIVDELESRLRSVRSQAGKARKYKEHSDQLRELRIQVGLTDWRSLSTSLSGLVSESRQLQAQVSEAEAKVGYQEEQLHRIEQASEAAHQHAQQAAIQATATRERIAHCESTRRSQMARIDELMQETQRLERQLLTMSSRAGSTQQLVADTAEQLESAEQQYHELIDQLEQEQSQLTLAQTSLAQCRNDTERCRNDHADVFRSSTQIEHRIEVVRTQHESAVSDGERLRQDVEQLSATRTEFYERWLSSNEQLKEQELAARQLHQNLTAAQDTLRENRQQLLKVQAELSDLKGRLRGAIERGQVLEELERQLDGLSAGTKAVLQQAQNHPKGPFGSVRGIVADLLHVDEDTAPLVEIALGDRANFLVIENWRPELFELAEVEWGGRTTFLRLDVVYATSAVDRIDLTGEPGVIGRADQFVEIDADLAPLTRRLLGRSWFVDNLSTAFQLADGAGRGLNFVTVVGEYLGADGTLTVGPRQSASGLLSRRSELRALQHEIAAMQETIGTQEATCADFETALEENEQEISELAKKHEQQSFALNETRLRVASIRERLDRASEELSTAESDLKTNDQATAAGASELASLRQQLTDKRASQAQLQSKLNFLAEQSTQWEKQVASLQPQVTDIRVALARSEQRRDGLRRQMEQLQRDHEEHDRTLAETQQRASECRTQQQQLNNSVLELTSELAELYAAKDLLIAELQTGQLDDENFRKRRAEASRILESLRTQLLEKHARQQQIELSVQQKGQQRKDLHARLQEDYHVELAVLAASAPVSEVADRSQAESEIRRLREQLEKIGPVSLDALTELETIEERYKSLSQQYHDLKSAKARLQQLVSNINSESRKIFVETLDVVREHFQELYRNLFGGGEADIIVEESDSDDVLECGIEIIARPPGKLPRSISLLSGGERTMTCVALLLAIFRSRPTPFCVLDEVDAALDEANIDRFVAVLRQFMSSTQFIVVTHSKRTMACADTLYGVTMQESGISKRVSVKFEDVSADGQIRDTSQAA